MATSQNVGAAITPKILQGIVSEYASGVVPPLAACTRLRSHLSGTVAVVVAAAATAGAPRLSCLALSASCLLS